MARNTDVRLRNQTIYSVFVRNHTVEGTFTALEKDLDRIAALGTDSIWLMPIHPIGNINRKGMLGSPYAIKDYRAVNPEYGTLADFRHLVDAIHARGMRCLIDVVFNHTSPDSWLVANHPEWFFHDAQGKPASHTAEWTDVADLDFAKKELWAYLIDTLVMWAKVVDGFRCDVASLVSQDFWMAARGAVAEVNPDCVWLAESVEPDFIRDNRIHGHTALSDGELFQAFDICYDYDVKHHFSAYLQGEVPLSRYVEAIVQQESMYPVNYVKLRFLENHDRPRAKELIPDTCALRNWTAFMYLLKGTAFIYAGQEFCVAHLPSLFDRDVIRWDTGDDWQDFFARLHALKKDSLLAEGVFSILAEDTSDVAIMQYACQGRRCIGVFSLAGGRQTAKIDLPNGVYHNQLSGRDVRVNAGGVDTADAPLWIIIE